MNTKEYGIEEAFIFTNENVKIEGKLNYLPIYMVMFLKDEPMEFADIRVGRYSQDFMKTQEQGATAMHGLLHLQC